MPEEFDKKMILCDQCHTWFHYKCVNLTPKDMEMPIPLTKAAITIS